MELLNFYSYYTSLKFCVKLILILWLGIQESLTEHQTDISTTQIVIVLNCGINW